MDSFLASAKAGRSELGIQLEDNEFGTAQDQAYRGLHTQLAKVDTSLAELFERLWYDTNKLPDAQKEGFNFDSWFNSAITNLMGITDTDTAKLADLADLAASIKSLTRQIKEGILVNMTEPLSAAMKSIEGLLIRGFGTDEEKARHFSKVKEANELEEARVRTLKETESRELEEAKARIASRLTPAQQEQLDSLALGYRSPALAFVPSTAYGSAKKSLDKYRDSVFGKAILDAQASGDTDFLEDLLTVVESQFKVNAYSREHRALSRETDKRMLKQSDVTGSDVRVEGEVGQAMQDFLKGALGAKRSNLLFDFRTDEEVIRGAGVERGLAENYRVGNVDFEALVSVMREMFTEMNKDPQEVKVAVDVNSNVNVTGDKEATVDTAVTNVDESIWGMPNTGVSAFSLRNKYNSRATN